MVMHKNVTLVTLVAATLATNNVITKLVVSLLSHMQCSRFSVISTMSSLISLCLKSFQPAIFNGRDDLTLEWGSTGGCSEKVIRLGRQKSSNNYAVATTTKNPGLARKHGNFFFIQTLYSQHYTHTMM